MPDSKYDGLGMSGSSGIIDVNCPVGGPSFLRRSIDKAAGDQDDDDLDDD